METVAVIPCRNEAKYVGRVVRQAKKQVDMVVVSDGLSTDKTVVIAKKAGAVVIGAVPGTQTGYGICMRRGIKWVIGEYKPDVVVILDGDGQHNPAEIPVLLELIKQGADVVMGCRTEGNMPSYRRSGNKLLTFVCNLGAKFRPPDAVTGYWALKTHSVPDLTEKKWGVAIELLIKSRSNGSKMAFVPIKAIYHEHYEDNSTTSPVKLALTLLWLIVKWRVICEVLRRKEK